MVLPTNVAFYFSGIKRKPLELYWNQTLCLLESVWLVCTSGATAVCGNRQEFMGCQSLPASAVGTVSAPTSFKPLGLMGRLILPCPDLQVASLVSQRSCAHPAVPFPRGCSEQPVCTKFAMELCPQASRKLGSWLENSGQEAGSPFSLRKPDQEEGCVLREQQETQELVQPSCGELGKPPSSIRLTTTQKRGFPLNCSSPSHFLHSERGGTKFNPGVFIF